MQECAEEYRDAVLEIYETMKQTCPDAIISVEQQVSFEEYVAGGFGTSDCVILGDGHMYVIDYKHGKGVEVSAEDNHNSSVMPSAAILPSPRCMTSQILLW